MMSHEELDEQIRAALHSEPPAEQVVRLERFWREKSRADAWRRRVWRVAALAATIVVVAALSLWQYQQSRSREARRIPIAQGSLPTAPVAPGAHAESVSAAPDVTVATEVRPGEDTFSGSRPPTAYERLIFAAQRRQSAAARSPMTAAAVDKLIEDMTRGLDVSAEHLVATTGLSARELEDALLRRLLRSTEGRKLAVLRLLAVCGTSRATPALLRISRRDALRDVALATLERIVGIQQLATLARQTADARVRAALARRLITADSEHGLLGYLSLVEDNDTRNLALAVVDGLPEPPVAKLLASLDDDDAAIRLSAAVVLGHLNGPEITKALVDRVVQAPAATAEAWIALLACRGEYAEDFLSYATRQPQLLVHVNSARVHWARMAN
jgi:hypothetical protein